MLAASEVVADAAAATTAGQRLGFPVFVKAAAGGGGRGLRRVSTPDELPVAVGRRHARHAVRSATSACSWSRP